MRSRFESIAIVALFSAALLVAASASAQTGARPPGPDLVVRSLANPAATVVPREALTASFVVTNMGKRSARQSLAAAYLSRDRSKGKGDLRLAPTSSVARLKPDRSARRNAAVVIPDATSAGPWFLIVCADDTSRVPETNERNNCRAATTPISVTKVPPPPPPAPPPPGPPPPPPGACHPVIRPSAFRLRRLTSTAVTFHTATSPCAMTYLNLTHIASTGTATGWAARPDR